MERRRFHTAVQVFRVIHKFFPTYLRDRFINAAAYTGRSGRNKDRLFISQVNTNFGKNGFFYRGTVIWNSLPSALYRMKGLLNFKPTYKKLCC